MTVWRRAVRRVPQSSMHPRDVLTEAVSALVARPSRSAFTTLGTVLGVSTLVVILCVTATLQGQVGARFNFLTATTVSVHDARTDVGPQVFPFTQAGENRAARLNGVTHAGTRWAVNLGTGVVAARAGADTNAQPVAVVAATPGLFSAVAARLSHGRTFDNFAENARAKVVVLGEATARQLGITSLVAQPAIFIANQPYTVVGIIDRVDSQSDLLLSVIIPATTAIARWGSPDVKQDATMTLTTRLGAAIQVASEAPAAIVPTSIASVQSVPPPDPKSLRDAVNGDLSGLFLTLAMICLLVGAVGIANTTLVAVLERTGEIGLRRSVGARRRDIAAQIITESGILGVLGGLVGSSIGILTVLAISITQHWAPVIDPTVVFTAPLVGMIIGIVAGLYPSWRATMIEPTEALRR